MLRSAAGEKLTVAGEDGIVTQTMSAKVMTGLVQSMELVKSDEPQEI